MPQSLNRVYSVPSTRSALSHDRGCSSSSSLAGGRPPWHGWLAALDSARRRLLSLPLRLRLPAHRCRHTPLAWLGLQRSAAHLDGSRSGPTMGTPTATRMCCLRRWGPSRWAAAPAAMHATPRGDLSLLAWCTVERGTAELRHLPLHVRLLRSIGMCWPILLLRADCACVRPSVPAAPVPCCPGTAAPRPPC